MKPDDFAINLIPLKDKLLASLRDNAVQQTVQGAIASSIRKVRGGEGEADYAVIPEPVPLSPAARHEYLMLVG